MGLSNKRLLLAKLEAVNSTAETALIASNAVMVGGLNITPMVAETVERNIIRPFLGANQGMVVSSHATVDFEVELAGSGVLGTAPHYESLMLACGFAKTGGGTAPIVYTPATPTTIADANTTLTLWFFADGTKHVLFGAKGTFSIDLTKAKNPTMKFTFTGLMGAVTAGTIASGTYTASTAPVPVGTINTSTALNVGGAIATPRIEAITFDIANEIKYHQLIGDERIVMLNRKPKGTLKIEANIGAKNFFDLARSNAVGTLSVVHGVTAGNIVTISTATNGMSIGTPKYSSTDGIDMIDLDLSLFPVAAAGNDELIITLS
jgi:hypothetical protein